MATRTYTKAGRTFEIVFSENPHPSGAYAAWSVENVYEAGNEVTIPGIDDVAASSEDEAFTRACGRIDKWLGPEPTAGTAPQFTSTKPTG